MLQKEECMDLRFKILIIGLIGGISNQAYGGESSQSLVQKTGDKILDQLNNLGPGGATTLGAVGGLSVLGGLGGAAALSGGVALGSLAYNLNKKRKKNQKIEEGSNLKEGESYLLEDPNHAKEGEDPSANGPKAKKKVSFTDDVLQREEEKEQRIEEEAKRLEKVAEQQIPDLQKESEKVRQDNEKRKKQQEDIEKALTELDNLGKSPEETQQDVSKGLDQAKEVKKQIQAQIEKNRANNDPINAKRMEGLLQEVEKIEEKLKEVNVSKAGKEINQSPKESLSEEERQRLLKELDEIPLPKPAPEEQKQRLLKDYTKEERAILKNYTKSIKGKKNLKEVRESKEEDEKQAEKLLTDLNKEKYGPRQKGGFLGYGATTVRSGETEKALKLAERKGYLALLKKEQRKKEDKNKPMIKGLKKHLR